MMPDDYGFPVYSPAYPTPPEPTVYVDDEERRRRREASNAKLDPVEGKPVPFGRDPSYSPPLVPESTTVPPPTEQPKRYTQTAIPDWNVTPPKVTPGVTPPSSVPQDAVAALNAAAQYQGNPFRPVSGIPEQLAPGPADAGDGYLKHSAKGMLSRAGDIGANVASFMARASEGRDSFFDKVFGDNTDENGFFDPNKPVKNIFKAIADPIGAVAAGFDAKDPDGKALTTAAVFRHTQKVLDGIMSESYTPRHDLDKEWNRFATTGNPMGLLGYSAEQAPQMVTDAMGAIFASPAYFASLVDDYATDVAVNDGRDPNKTTAVDNLKAVPLAIFSFAVDRVLGEGKVTGGIAKLLGRVKDQAPSTMMRRIASRGIEGFYTEAADEAVSYTGTSLGTQTGFDPKQAALNALGGGLAGAPAGGSMGIFRGHEDHAANTGVGEDATAALEQHDTAGQTGQTAIPPAADAAVAAAPPTATPFNEGSQPTPYGPFSEGGIPFSPYAEGTQPPPSGPFNEGGIPLPPPPPLPSEPAPDAKLTPVPDEEPAAEPGLTSADLAETTGAVSLPGGDMVKADTQSKTFQKDYPKEKIAQMQAEADRKEADRKAKSMPWVKAKDIARNPRKYANSAGMKLLSGLDQGMAIEEDTEASSFRPSSKQSGKNTRWATKSSNLGTMNQLFTNLSDAARVLSSLANKASQATWTKGQGKGALAAGLKESKAGSRSNESKDFEEQARKLEDVGLLMAQVRTQVQAFAQDDANSPRVETMMELFSHPDIASGLKSMGFDADSFRKAALESEDRGALLGVIDKMNTKAKGIVQRWESKAGTAEESQAYQVEGGRGVRPGFEDAAETKSRDDNTFITTSEERKAYRKQIRGEIDQLVVERERLREELKTGVLSAQQHARTPVKTSVVSRAESRPAGKPPRGSSKARSGIGVFGRKKGETVEQWMARRKAQGEAVRGGTYVRYTPDEEVAITRSEEKKRREGIQARLRRVNASIAEANARLSEFGMHKVKARQMQADAELTGRQAHGGKAMLAKELHTDKEGRKPKEGWTEEQKAEREAAQEAEDLALARKYGFLDLTREDLPLAGDVKEREGVKKKRATSKLKKGEQFRLLRKYVTDLRKEGVSQAMALQQARDVLKRLNARQEREQRVKDEEKARKLAAAVREAQQKSSAQLKEMEDAEAARGDEGTIAGTLEAEAEREAAREAARKAAAAEADDKASRIAAAKVYKQARFRAARHAWDQFKNAVEAKRAEGDVNGMLALASHIWSIRKTFRPDPDGLLVEDVASDNADFPFRRMYNVIPKVNPSKFPRRRYRATSIWNPKTRKAELVYRAHEVENWIGQKMGPDHYIDSKGNYRAWPQPLHKNTNLISPFERDRLIRLIQASDIRATPPLISNIADMLIYDAQEKSSGARGYEGRNADRPKLPPDPYGTPPKPRTGRIEPGGQVVIDDGPDDETPPTEEPPPDDEEATKDTIEETPPTEDTGPTDEEVDRLKAILERFLPPLPSGGKRDDATATAAFGTKKTNLEAILEGLRTEIAIADAVRPQLADSIASVPIGKNDEGAAEVTYHLPPTYPKSAQWRKKIVATYSKNTNTVVTNFDETEIPYEGDASFAQAIAAEIDDNIATNKIILANLEKQYQEFLDAWANYRAAVDRTGPRPVRAPEGVTPTSATISRRKDDIGISPPVSSDERRPVNVLAGFGTPDKLSEVPALARFRAGVSGAVASWGLGPDQFLQSTQIVNTWMRRKAFMAEHPGLSSVNRSGYLLMSGTGSGKTRIIGAAARAIAEMSGKKVLIVLKHGLMQKGLNEWRDNLGFTDEDAKHLKFITYHDLDGKISGDYAAVFFDEAHLIKGSKGAGANWMPNAEAIQADMRVFATATPTDKMGQEAYYLRYMIQDDIPRDLATAWRKVTTDLGTTKVAAGNKQAKVDPKVYARMLDKYQRAIIKNNAASNWSMSPTAINSVVDIPQDSIDQRATEAHNAASEGDKPFYLEHMKIPYMVERAVASLRAGEDVIAVFRHSGTKGAWKSPPVRFASELAIAAAKAGIDLGGVPGKMGSKIEMLVGSREGGDSEEDDKSERFKSSQSRVFVMTDSRGSTGLDLHAVGKGNPKRMLISRTSDVGEVWLQVIGRPDRRGQTYVPHIDYIGINDNETDRKFRNSIKAKTDHQREVTGAKTASKSPEVPFSLEGTMEKDPFFRKGDLPRHTLPVDRVVQDRLKYGENRGDRLVNDIARNDTDPDIAAVAEALKGHPALANLRVAHMPEAVIAKALEDGHDVPMGAYDLATHTAYINPDAGGLEATTVLHEVAHHLTHEAIDRNPVARQRLLQIMAAVPVTPGVTNIKTDPHEFVAEAYANPEFQQVLKSIKLGPKLTLWGRFKEFVRRLIGHPAMELSAFDAVMEMRLTDPHTIEELGRGDPSEHLNNLMFRSFTPPEKVKEIIERGRYVNDPAFKNVLLPTLSFNQIMESFGKLATEVRDGKSINHLEVLYNLMSQRFGKVTEERNIYSKRVLEPLRQWALDYGSQRIMVQMEPGKPKIEMTRLQYLSELMNISGYAQVHFGKSVTDPENVMLVAHPRKTPLRPGQKPRQRTRSDHYWDLHKQQFDRTLDPAARELYNNLAAFFAKEVDRTSMLRAQQWLDAAEPRKDGQSWHNLEPTVVRAELNRLGKISEEDLAKDSIVKDSLAHLKSILEPGRVPGAYFPLRRFGEYVVKVNEHIPYKTENERERLLKQHLGSKATDTHVNYKSVSRFESEFDAQRFINDMKAKYPDAEVSNVLIAGDTYIQEKVGFSESLIRAFEARVNDQNIPEPAKQAQIKMFTQSMIDLMPEASYANTFRPRAGVLGASLDVQRSLNAYGSALAHHTAAALYSTPQRQANRAFQQFIYGVEHEKPDLKASIRDDGGKRGRQLRRIHNELAAREAQQAEVFAEGKWGSRLNNIGFAWYLTGMSYNLMNMTQPIMLTVPYLGGRHGAIASAAAMRRAYAATGGAPFAKLAKTGFTLTELKNLFALKGTRKDFDRKNYGILDEIITRLDPGALNEKRTGPVSAQDARAARVLRTLADRNLIEVTVAMDMGQGAAHSHIDPATGKPRAQSKTEYLSEWMRMGPHITEVLNRSVTGIAAYELEYNKQLRAGKTAGEADTIALRYAEQAINETQFNYQNWNKPRIMQGGALSRAMLMFKQHPQHVLYFMTSRAIQSSLPLRKLMHGQKMTPEEATQAKEARRQLAIMMGMAVLASGAIGATPEPLKWIIGLMNMIFGTDDEPFNFELYMQQTMTDLLGPEWGAVGARGLPVLAGMDLSGRIGYNSLLLYGDIKTDDEDAFVSSAVQMAGGPLASLFFVRGYKAGQAVSKGDWNRFVEAVSPKPIVDIARTYRLSQEGFATYNGRVFAGSDALTPSEYVISALGITPNKTSMIWLSRTVEQQDQQMHVKAGALMGDAYNALGDRRALIDKLRKIDQWNKDNPAYPITQQKLIQSFKTRAAAQRRTQHGMLTSTASRPHADYQNRFRESYTGVN